MKYITLPMALAALMLTAPVHAAGAAGFSPEAHGPMSVARDPNCGCCGLWIALAEAEGWTVEITETADLDPIKRAAGVPDTLASCHTAKVEGYVIEGHVPFEAIARLLTERPEVTGLAVPGMPYGSPGMGDDPTARYDVIAFGGEAGEGVIFYRAGLE